MVMIVSMCGSQRVRMCVSEDDMYNCVRFNKCEFVNCCVHYFAVLHNLHCWFNSWHNAGVISNLITRVALVLKYSTMICVCYNIHNLIVRFAKYISCLSFLIFLNIVFPDNYITIQMIQVVKITLENIFIDKYPE